MIILEKHFEDKPNDRELGEFISNFVFLKGSCQGRNQAGSKVTTAVQTGSSYVDSGGSKSVDDQSSLSGGGAGRSDVTDRKSIKKNDVNQKPTISYNVLTHFFSLNNSICNGD